MKNILLALCLIISASVFAQDRRQGAKLVSDGTYLRAESDAVVKIRERVFRLPDGSIETTQTEKRILFSDTASLGKAKKEAQVAIQAKREQIKRLQAEIKAIEDEVKYMDGEFQKKKGKKESAPPVNTKINLHPISEPAPEVKLNVETTSNEPNPKTKKKRKKQ